MLDAKIENRMKTLRNEGKTYVEIAKILDAEKFTTTNGKRISAPWVQNTFFRLRIGGGRRKKKTELLTIPVESPVSKSKVIIVVAEWKDATSIIQEFTNGAS